MFKHKLPFILSAIFFGLFIAERACCQSVSENIMELNVEYDNETNHMWNRSKQQFWQTKINERISKVRTTN